jgi:23S rRNA (cytosine1962-C5)-methyltransferase
MKLPPTVKLHPHTIKHLKVGHPWITKDTFTESFPKTKFVQWKENDDIYIFLNDWNHPKVKARLWIEGMPHKTWSDQMFLDQLKLRLTNAFQLRRQSAAWNEREDFYLVYAENDEIPGIMILRLGNNILIQNYLDFWKSWQKQLMKYVATLGHQILGGDFNLIWQDRSREQKKELQAYAVSGGAISKTALPLPLVFEIVEYGIRYQIKIGEDYDFGLYPDMAEVRQQLFSYFKNKTLLNLYSYTGAFGLYALKQGAKSVVNVDNSSKAHQWLEKNLELNPQLPRENSLQVKSDVAKELLKLVKEGQKFDLIVCDPPPFSSRKTKTGKTSKGVDIYQSLPTMLNLLAPKGKILAALNTQKVSPKQFEDQLRKMLKDTPNFQLQASAFALLDCPNKRGFPEGKFLKLIVIEKK